MVAQKYNFPITADGKVSQAFLERGMKDFAAAAEHIQQMPYGRNANKLNLLTVFTDGCATCSTKHAILKQLADENGAEGVRLILCLFKMDAKNTRSVKDILERSRLSYMPEAHNYLRVKGELLDVTKKNWSIERFPEAIMEEHEIMPEQITDYKVAYQKSFMNKWLGEHPEIGYSLEELFAIREECIKALY
jgi:hypothetical protein